MDILSDKTHKSFYFSEVEELLYPEVQKNRRCSSIAKIDTPRRKNEKLKANKLAFKQMM